MIEGISHITFVVHDLEKATRFFREIFDAEEVYSSGDTNHPPSGSSSRVISLLRLLISSNHF
jgi:catechol 2,3-dioxygenase-like lactoylglutathione lyase family enzyme